MYASLLLHGNDEEDGCLRLREHADAAVAGAIIIILTDACWLGWLARTSR
jgi:hypothetical protein